MLTWNGICPYCGSRDIALQRVTKHNEHWACGEEDCRMTWFVPIEESIKASTKSGVRCWVDELVMDISFHGSGESVKK